MTSEESQLEEIIRQMRDAYERAGMDLPPGLETDHGFKSSETPGKGDSNKDQEKVRGKGHAEEEAGGGEGGKSHQPEGKEDEGEGKGGGKGDSDKQGESESEQDTDKEKSGEGEGKKRRRRKKKEIPQPDENAESHHPQFNELLVVVKQDIPAMLVGPAGSGKTTTCSQVAEELQLPFYAQSFCAQTSLSQLVGYKDAVGIYHPSIFRMAFEHGGLYLVDEIDAGNPNVTAFLNAAISNGFCSFPDAMVRRHKDFRIVAAANTFGTGKTIEYIGRNPIDAATLDRFVQISWPYDEEFESKIVKYEKWLKVVRAFRKAVIDRGIRHIISPRASIYGTKLLAAGMPLKRVVKIAIIKGLDEGVEKSLLSTAEIKLALAEYSKPDEEQQQEQTPASE